MNALLRKLRAVILADGPISVAHYMAACLFDPRDGYYVANPGLGADFTTAPEISQMFGELLGLWAVQSWLELGSPDPFALIELGPGRGVLFADAWRAARSVAPEFTQAAFPVLIEASPRLAAAQGARLAPLGIKPRWAARLDDAWRGPMILLANEFLDCLPIRQFVRTKEGWRERLIGLNEEEALCYCLDQHTLRDDALIPPALFDAGPGAIAEIRPSLEALIDQLAARLRAHPGRALWIDYGPPSTQSGDSLQAVQAGKKLSPLAEPGLSDLSAHVDFAALRRLARACGLSVAGPVPQGAWLEQLGIAARLEGLAAAHPGKAEALTQERSRLVDPSQMGTLFQVMCISSPGLCPPAGF